MDWEILCIVMISAWDLIRLLRYTLDILFEILYYYSFIMYSTVSQVFFTCYFFACIGKQNYIFAKENTMWINFKKNDMI